MLKANSGDENARADPDEAKQALASELEARVEPEQPVYVLTKDLAEAAGVKLLSRVE